MSGAEGLISDDEIARVHGHANFGTMTPRQVVNDGIRKIAVGYHCGHTKFSILREHGLITKPKGMSYDCNLTKKGKRYFRALSAIEGGGGQESEAVEHLRRCVQLVPEPGAIEAAERFLARTTPPATPQPADGCSSNEGAGQ